LERDWDRRVDVADEPKLAGSILLQKVLEDGLEHIKMGREQCNVLNDDPEVTSKLGILYHYLTDSWRTFSKDCRSPPP
jgi:hypothetical protein